MNRRNFLDNLQRKWGKYAIYDLTKYMIGMYVIGFILILITNGAAGGFLYLDMNAVFHGQIWRLVTFLMIPPGTSFLVIITLIFYASIGRTLEQTWGTFYYNVYIFSGIIFTILGNLVSFIIVSLANGYPTSVIGTNYYILMSMFLAFALLYPDMQVLLMFIIPIKVKWMAYGYYALMIYQIYQDLQFIRAGNVYMWGDVASIIMSLLNFFIFYYLTRQRTHVTFKQKRRKKAFQQKMVRPNGITKHKCAVCGATDESNPELEFRFCSKCNGNYEYCQNHLFTHTHVK